MRSSWVAVVCMLALAGGAARAEAASVVVGPGPLSLRAGKLRVRLSCPAGTCRGSVETNRAPVRFRLRAAGRDTVVLRVRTVYTGVRVALLVKQGHRRRRVHRPLELRAVQRRWCGYSTSSEVLAETASARLLRAPLLGPDEDPDDNLIAVCQQGRPLPLSYETSETFDTSSTDLADTPTLTDDWAAVAIRSEDHYGLGFNWIVLRSLRPPFERRSTYLGLSRNDDPPVPDRISIAPDGALLLGRPTHTTFAPRPDPNPTYDVCAIDGRGGRLLDRAPGVDPASLALTGQVAGWTRDGVAQSATLTGPPPDNTKRYYGTGRNVC